MNKITTVLFRNLNFQDIHLVPRVISEIHSRNDIQTKVDFGQYVLTSPIIASPMKDVCNGLVAAKMKNLGGLGIIHRFFPVEQQVKEYLISKDSPCAIGINDQWFERFSKLYEVGCRTFCIDVANGANVKVRSVIEGLSKYKIDLIVGNVASKECYKWLQDLPNVKGIRCGISGGSACSTRNATGVSHGMISVIHECASVKSNTLLIADGGITEPSDMCKAIAFGADMVMLGSSIAATVDSPAEILEKDGKMYKVYHGSASFEIQKHYKDTPRYIEGKLRLLEFKSETLDDLIIRFCDGLRSSMSYFNAVDFEKYRNNVSYVID